MIEAPIYAALTADCHRLAQHRILGGEPTEERIAARHATFASDLDQEMEKLMNVPHEQTRQWMICLTENLNGFIRQTQNISTAFESLLASMVIQAWGAFELLATDLCTLSMERHPTFFQHVASSGELRFQRRVHMRASFDSAYAKDSTINRILKDQAIDALSILRNLFVHNAGIVNEYFIGQCREAHLKAWAELPCGAPVAPFDGDVLRRLVDPVIFGATKLIQAVDSRLTIFSHGYPSS